MANLTPEIWFSWSAWEKACPNVLRLRAVNPAATRPHHCFSQNKCDFGDILDALVGINRLMLCVVVVVVVVVVGGASIEIERSS